MSSISKHERTQLERLQTEYRRAWQDFTVSVEALQTMKNNDGVAAGTMAEARHQVETSVSVYRGARNALAGYLLAQDSARKQDDRTGEGAQAPSSITRSQAA